jgi:hypothetical protein
MSLFVPLLEFNQTRGDAERMPTMLANIRPTLGPFAPQAPLAEDYWVRLWKVELQKLAEELGFPIQVCHLPPATSNGTRSSTGCFPLLA